MTIVDIARAAGVSKSTVSLVLTSPGKLRPETEKTVRDAMRDLGYVYHRGAASLRNPKSRVVGMVINDLSNPFFAELAIGIERVLRGEGYIPFLANTGESVDRQADVVASMREHGASGIILCPALGTKAVHLEALENTGVPLVLAIRRVEGARLPLVASDNRGGAEQATRHLIAVGHRRIGFVGGRVDMGIHADRLSGFEAAHRAAGRSLDPALVVESAPTKDGGFDAMTALLARRRPPTAVLCFNDVVAIGAMAALVRLKLAPGDDVAIVGFDDTSEARHASPALSTVAVGVEALGETAAQVLLRRIEGTAKEHENYVGAARLVIRESSGKSMKTREVA